MVNQYWFRKRRPISWEGWALTIGMVIAIIMYSSKYNSVNLTESMLSLKSIGVIAVIVIAFVYIADKKTDGK